MTDSNTILYFDNNKLCVAYPSIPILTRQAYGTNAYSDISWNSFADVNDKWPDSSNVYEIYNQHADKLLTHFDASYGISPLMNFGQQHEQLKTREEHREEQKQIDDETSKIIEQMLKESNELKYVTSKLDEYYMNVNISKWDEYYMNVNTFFTFDNDTDCFLEEEEEEEEDVEEDVGDEPIVKIEEADLAPKKLPRQEAEDEYDPEVEQMMRKMMSELDLDSDTSVDL